MMRETDPRTQMLQIFNKLRDWWSPPAKHVAAPRRVKHYAAQTGYQYQYRLEMSLPGEYRFSIWTTGQPVRAMNINVPLPGLAPRDRYALAKLHLFRNFDERAPAELPVTLEVTETAALDEL